MAGHMAAPVQNVPQRTRTQPQIRPGTVPGCQPGALCEFGGVLGCASWLPVQTPGPTGLAHVAPGGTPTTTAAVAQLQYRGRASPGIMPGSGSDPGVILGPGSCIPAVFWLVRIQLVVSQRIPAEMCSAGLKYRVVAPLITTNLTKTTGFRRFSARFSASTSPLG